MIYNKISLKTVSWLLTAVTFSYFIYHTYHGERGLIAQKGLLEELADLQKTYQTLHAERTQLSEKIKGLGAGNAQIDADLLAEYTRNLGYAYPDEIMIVD